jgi:hypothetical protein
MEYSCITLTDLPDEILLMICQKLNNFDVIYCLKGMNQRIDRIVHDPMFTTHLSFVKWSRGGFLDLLHCDMIRHRYCLQILPSIHDQIKRLDLEVSSMKEILCATSYPNLNRLSLYNIDEESIRFLLTSKTILFIPNTLKVFISDDLIIIYV